MLDPSALKIGVLGFWGSNLLAGSGMKRIT